MTIERGYYDRVHRVYYYIEYYCIGHYYLCGNYTGLPICSSGTVSPLISPASVTSFGVDGQ